MVFRELDLIKYIFRYKYKGVYKGKYLANYAFIPTLTRREV